MDEPERAHCGVSGDGVAVDVVVGVAHAQGIEPFVHNRSGVCIAEPDKTARIIAARIELSAEAGGVRCPEADGRDI